MYSNNLASFIFPIFICHLCKPPQISELIFARSLHWNEFPRSSKDGLDLAELHEAHHLQLLLDDEAAEVLDVVSPAVAGKARRTLLVTRAVQHAVRSLLLDHDSTSLHIGAVSRLCQVLNFILLQQFLKIVRLLVSEIEEAVPGVMGVKTELSAARLLPALGAHLERLVAANAEFVLALNRTPSLC